MRDPEAVEDFRRLSAAYAGHLHALMGYFGLTALDWLRSPTG